MGRSLTRQASPRASISPPRVRHILGRNKEGPSQYPEEAAAPQDLLFFKSSLGEVIGLC